MSQVKKNKINKFASGGRYIKDGKEYVYNDDFKNQFNSFIDSLPEQQRFYLADVRDKLERGEDVIFDSQRSELNVPFSGLSDRQLKRMQRYRSKTGQFFDALTNNKVQNAAMAIEALRDFQYVPKEEVLPALPNVNFIDRTLQYTTKDGKKSFANTPTNTSILSDIQNLDNYFNLGNQGDSNYTITGLDMDRIRSWKEKNPDGFTGLLNRIQNNTLTDEDESTLADLRIFLEEVKTPTITPEQQQVEYQKEIFGNDTPNGSQVTVDKDQSGNWITHNFQLPQGYGVAYLSKSSPFAGTRFEGGAWMNGRLYTEDEIFNEAKYNTPEYTNLRAALQPYREAQLASNINNILNSGVYDWGNYDAFVQYNPNKDYMKNLYEYFYKNRGNLQGDQTFWVSNLNGQYELPEGYSLYAYIDPSNQRNRMGIPNKVNYLSWDPQNRRIQYYGNAEQLPYKLRNQVEMTTPTALHVTPWANIDGQNGEFALFDTLVSADDDTQYQIYKDRNNKYYIKIGNKFGKLNMQLYKDIKSGKVPATPKNLDLLFSGNPSSSNVNFSAPQYLSTTYTPYLVPKNQFGGILDNVEKQNKTQDSQNFDHLRDITKGASVKRIGDKDELTSADKWQLAAIAADVGGLLTTLVPGVGNVAGAATGIGSTAAQFTSDIKRDGLDWGDVGRFIGSLGLDALTLIPGFGAGAKTAKVLRNVKKASKIIGNAFAAYGLSSAAASLNNLTDENKEWSIDDLRNVVVGLQSVIGLKRTFTDKALATRKVKTETQTPAQKTFADRKKEFIDNKLKGNEELTKKYSTESGIDYEAAGKDLISKGDLVKLRTTSGLNTVGSATKKFWNRVNPKYTREIKEVTYDPNASAWERFKQSATNRAIARYSTNHHKTTNAQYSDYEYKPGNGLWWYRFPTKKVTTDVPVTQNQTPHVQIRGLLQETNPIIEIQRTTPQRVTPEIRTTSVESPINTVPVEPQISGLLGGSQRRMRAIATRQPATSNDVIYASNSGQAIRINPQMSDLRNASFFLTNRPEIARIWTPEMLTVYSRSLSPISKRSRTPESLFNSVVQNVTPISLKDVPSGRFERINTDMGVFVGNNGQKYHVLIGDLRGILGDVAFIPNSPSAVNAFFKDGGKISKFQSGGVVVTDPVYVYEKAKPKPQLAYPNITLPKVDINYATVDQMNQLNNGQTLNAMSQQPNSIGQHMHLNLPEINKDSILSLIGLYNTYTQNNKAYDYYLNGINAKGRAGLSAPQEIYNSFQDYGINEMYNQKANAEENYIPITSDPKIAAAMALQAKSQANNTRLEGRLKLSQLFSQYQDQQANLRRNYANIRADIANKNKQLGADVAMMKGQAQASHVVDNFTNFNNWLMEKRYNLNKKENQQNALESKLAAAKTSILSQNEYDKALAPWMSEFVQFRKNNPNENIDFQTWITRTHPEQMNEIRKRMHNAEVRTTIPLWNQQYRINLNENDWLFKRGGKVVKKVTKNSGKRTAAEQIWIDQNKHAANAVKMLNQNIIRIFMKNYK